MYFCLLPFCKFAEINKKMNYFLYLLQTGAPRKRENMFLICKDDDCVTWKPDFETYGNVWDQLFLSLRRIVRNKFQMKQTPMFYNPYNSVPCIDISLLDNLDSLLTENNIEKYWKLLENSKYVSILKFWIDTDNIICNSKRAICISAHSNTNETKLCSILIKKDGKDIDWEKSYFNLLVTANKMTNTKFENIDSNSDIEYDKLPYRIFKFKKSNKVLEKMKDKLRIDDKYLEESYKYRDLYDLDEEVVDYGIFSDCYGNDNGADGKYWVFLIEHKQCFEVSNNKSKKKYFWKPSKVEDINWNWEFKRFKEEICSHFDLKNNSNLSLTQMNGESLQTLNRFEYLQNVWGMF